MAEKRIRHAHPRFKLILEQRGKKVVESLKVPKGWRFVVRYRKAPTHAGLLRGNKGKFVNIQKLTPAQFRRLRLKPEVWIRNPQRKVFKRLSERVNSQFKGFRKNRRKLTLNAVVKAVKKAQWKVRKKKQEVEITS